LQVKPNNNYMHTIFYLKGVSKESLLTSPGETLRVVYIYYKCRNGQFRKSTEVKVRECDWVEKDKKGNVIQRVSAKVTGGYSLNSILDQFKLKADSYIQSCKVSRKHVYREDLELIFSPAGKEEKDNKELFIFLQEYISYQGKTTRANYEKLLVHLEAFNKAKKFGVCWSELDERFYKMYLYYLANEYVNPNDGTTGILNSTAGKDIAYLKKLCRVARKKKVDVNPEVFEFKKPAFQTKRLAVSEDDMVEKLLSLDIDSLTEEDLCFSMAHEKEAQNTKRLGQFKIRIMKANLERIRDCYIFGFETGLRYSDKVKLSDDHLTYAPDDFGNFVRVIEVSQTKTKSLNIIPLSGRAIAILNKWKDKQIGLLPVYKCEQTYNRYLKRLFKLAGFTKSITLTRWKGANEVVETFQEWELMSSRVERHSCAQDLLDKTDDISLAGGMLGHSSLKTTEVYAKNNKKKFISKVLKAKEGGELYVNKKAL